MMAAPTTPMSEDDLLRKRLGFWSLFATGVGSVIGSGWLFASLYAAKAAGPAALLSWLVAGVLMLLVGLVFAELGMVKPESGGLVRYPMYSNGRLAAAIVGWSMWLAYASNPPTEAAGVVQYASAYLPGVYSSERLTGWGILLAGAIMGVFVLINYFGVQLFARTNNVVTAIKVFIPAATIAGLTISGFDDRNFALSHGGWAPYGWAAPLSAIATAGLVFTYTGYRNVIELSGEAHNPRRNVPIALIATIVVTMLLYLGLQVALLGAIPGSLLGHGWRGVNLNSPFANLALMLNLSWLYWMLVADSMVSPAGAGIVYTASNARNTFGLAKNNFFPRWTMKVNQRSGVPARALLINYAVGLIFLLPLPSWHAIIGVSGTLAIFCLAVGSISVIAFRRAGLSSARTRIPGMRIIAPAAFVVSSLVMFWVPWTTMLKTIPILVLGLIVYGINYLRDRKSVGDARAGVWLLGYLATMYILSMLGTFGGNGIIPAPLDTVSVAAVSFGIYRWGVASGVAFMRKATLADDGPRSSAQSAHGSLPPEEAIP